MFSKPRGTEYHIKGTAEYVTEGDVVATFKKMVEQMFNGVATAKGDLKQETDMIEKSCPFLAANIFDSILIFY